MPAATKGGKRRLTDEAADAANPAVAEAAAQETSRLRPEGMPACWPLHALPRRERVARKALVNPVMADVGELTNRLKAVKDAVAGKDDADITAAERSEIVSVMSTIEELALRAGDALVAGAQEPDLMETWVEEQDDNTVLEAFAWYARTANSGEATGSQTS